MDKRDERTFTFEGRPSRGQALEIIRAALADEGLVLETPGQTNVIRMVIDGDGLQRVIVPAHLITSPLF
jgi:hypothetical protein